MKTLTLTLLLLLSVTYLTLIKEITAQCYDYTNALDISARTPISCNIVDNIKEPPPPPIASPQPPPSSPPPSSSPSSSSLLPTASISPPVSSPLPSASISPPPTSSPLPSASANLSTNNFIINFKCEIETNQELCTKAQQSIEKVCELLKSNLNLITNIKVDVTLRNLCPTDAKQPCNELGGATFARTMELLDDDNVIREYPTTLVKQFDCERHYEFGDVDIRAIFNGGNVNSLWFEGDPQITTDQKDFRIIVLKEFIKALGVQTSLIEQPIFLNVTPKVLTPQLTLTDNGGGLEFMGFKEYAFDKYLMFRGKQVQPVNENIRSLNDFAKVPDNKFNDQQEFVTKFVQSQQIGVAQNMANLSVTQFTLGFQPRGSKSDDDIIILETFLNPYQNGININNFDASVYAATDDFLMISPITSGKTLEDSMGKFPSPLGPKLISLLETLGYPTKRLPNNNFKVCNIPSPPSSPSPSKTVTTAVTTSVTTQITTTVPVVVTTTIQQDNTSVVSTQTQNVVTKVESVSQSVVTTVVVVDAPQSQPIPSPTNSDDPFQGGIYSSSPSFKNQNNFSSIIFIILIVCIIGSF